MKSSLVAKKYVAMATLNVAVLCILLWTIVSNNVAMACIIVSELWS